MTNPPNISQEFEQLGAAVRDFAPVVWSFYRSLKKEGFNDTQALQLCISFATATFGGRNG